ncbi:MAG TPA: Rrf2 family transcriptional regulator [Kiritimatiellia bacterium]|nr:Rrf2 family transcriptional regulator [Kiritimatiellia bacterium]HMO98074.1 Rrf2 family transcriptional regulator [Kiritimatiellia bacterium]HMP97708.1 Rrf2 family transcriptional regulator [Kiritimatiellia bacterium]
MELFPGGFSKHCLPALLVGREQAENFYVMISNRCLYALKATLELSLRHRNGPVTIGQIAEAQRIPVRFLEAILRQLKQAGLAASQRGKEGGYTLARPPHEITMGMIIRLFEGPLVAFGKTDGDAADGETPGVFDTVWKNAEAALAAVYDATDFGALADRELNRAEIAATNFTI